MATNGHAVDAAVQDATETAVAAAIRANDPLPYLNEYRAADDAASEVFA